MNVEDDSEISKLTFSNSGSSVVTGSIGIRKMFATALVTAASSAAARSSRLLKWSRKFGKDNTQKLNKKKHFSAANYFCNWGF
jgi:hypothetical protein